MPNRELALDVLRFPLIVGVAYIHSYNPALRDMGEFATWIHQFLTNGVFSLSVPVFFFISGYLIFRRSYKETLLNRLRTIGVPYVFWLLFYYGLMTFTRHHVEPFPPQFWFLHELFFLIIISPVFRLLHRKRMTSLAVLAGVWLFFDWQLNYLVLSSALPILFFYAGTVVQSLPKNKALMVTCGAIAVTLFCFNHPIAHKLGIIAGTIALLGIAGKLANTRFGLKLAKLSPASLFVFGFHQPLVQILFARLYLLFGQPQSDFSVMLLYVISPAAIVAVAVFLFNTLSEYFPAFLRTINGGRISYLE